jgi:hypothetical protein
LVAVTDALAAVHAVTYFPDGSRYSFLNEEADAINIGWLDADHPFPTGRLPDTVIAALAQLCRNGLRRTRGWHSCELCLASAAEASACPTAARDGEGEFIVGDAEIRVRAPDGTVFAAPNMIIHYVTDHGYRPPDSFTHAVLSDRGLPE